MNDFVIEFMKANPWAIYVYFCSALLAIGLRAAYDVTEERPRLVRFVIAIVDLAQLNFSGPAKLISNRLKGQDR